ncbi:MAG: hypothetical protein V4471_04880 [Pseudomonadota bacterium]
MYFTIHKKIINIKKNIFSKKFIYYLYISIKDTIRLLLTIKKYFLKKILYHLISLARKYTPIWLKIRIKYKILLYPRIIKFLKYIRVWLNSSSKHDKIIFIDYLLISLIRWVFLPILNSILDNKTWKIATLQQLKDFPQLKAKVKKILNLNVSPNKIHKEIPLLVIEKDKALTCTTEQIYRDLKLHLPSRKLIID